MMARPRSLVLNLEGLSAEATVDGPAVLRKVIFNSLKDGGIDTSRIEGIECFSKTLWYVVFKGRLDKRDAKDKTIELYGKSFTLNSTEYERPRIQYTWVRLYGYPLDTDSTFLRKTMEIYGELISLQDEMDGRLQIKTGVKLAQFESLKGNIPSFVHVGRHRVRTAYRGQVKTCRNCHKEGHEVKECTAGRVCKQCGEPGHTKGDCPERLCFQCMGKGHEASQCPEYHKAFPRLGEDEPTETDEIHDAETLLAQRDPWQTERERENSQNNKDTEAMESEVSTSPPSTSTPISPNVPQDQVEPNATPELTNPAPPSNTTLSNETTETTRDNAHEQSEKTPDTTHHSEMDISNSTPPTKENPAVETEIPPLNTDTTDSSEEEAEPPLKTSKTTTKEQQQNGNGIEPNEGTTETVERKTTAKVSGKQKKKKKSKDRQPAINVAKGKNRSPFMH